MMEQPTNTNDDNGLNDELEEKQPENVAHEDESGKIDGEGDTTSRPSFPSKCKEFVSKRWTSYFADIDHSAVHKEAISIRFGKMHRMLTYAQWVLAIIFLMAGLAVGDIRSFIIARAWQGKFVIFALEFSSWVALSVILRWINVVPVNYVPLAIMRIFLCAELQYEWELDRIKQEAAALKKQSWWYTATLFDMDKLRFWSWGSEIEEVKAKVANQSSDALIHTSALLMASLFLTGWVLTKFTKIRIDKYGSIMLAGSFICTTVGSVILVSSLAMDNIGQELHLTLCKIWTPFSVLLIFVFTFYLLQRSLCANEEYWIHRRFADAEFAWLCIEIVICIVHASVVLRYIPAIHEDFNTGECLKLSVVGVLNTFIPSALRPRLVTEAYNFMRLTVNIFENYYSSIPYSHIIN